MTSALPTQKLLRVTPGSSFDYPFQYLAGSNASSAAPVPLSNYTATWVITWQGGSTTYTTGSPPTITIPETSGVFFGGQNNDLTSGVIDMMLTAATTSGLAWTVATYTLTLHNTVTNSVSELLNGGITTVSIAT